jgi:hypothetical protein
MAVSAVIDVGTLMIVKLVVGFAYLALMIFVVTVYPSINILLSQYKLVLCLYELYLQHYSPVK